MEDRVGGQSEIGQLLPRDEAELSRCESRDLRMHRSTIGSHTSTNNGEFDPVDGVRRRACESDPTLVARTLLERCWALLGVPSKPITAPESEPWWTRGIQIWVDVGLIPNSGCHFTRSGPMNDSQSRTTGRPGAPVDRAKGGPGEGADRANHRPTTQANPARRRPSEPPHQPGTTPHPDRPQDTTGRKPKMIVLVCRYPLSSPVDLTRPPGTNRAAPDGSRPTTTDWI